MPIHPQRVQGAAVAMPRPDLPGIWVGGQDGIAVGFRASGVLGGAGAAPARLDLQHRLRRPANRCDSGIGQEDPVEGVVGAQAEIVRGPVRHRGDQGADDPWAIP